MELMIVDDHPLFREGLKTIVSRDEKYTVVCEAGNGADGIRLGKRHRPAIMLVDISMPGKNGIQMIRELKQTLPETRFIIISMHSEADYIVEAFRAGASGYMIKESAAGNLIRGLDAVARGELFLDDALSQEVVYKLMQAKDGQGSGRDPYTTLTAREQEVLRMLAEGMTAREVAAKLFISPKTVENHRTNLMKKLGLHSTVELIRYAARLGLIDLDTWAI
ncbi:MAG: response regulator transcription factor [Pseudodesulfovibrio sp.]|uniref:Response regulator receiver n=1 Tax=Pseudodesulfovibrio aespoeensis (strain ATCC 700646 / DSM 10631 / Aspo-2) TaxID=643562 RepID=E6VRQ5_PSEA9|nr:MULTISPECIES: response regulator transcription factor [Pseudodesulfovibrio]MBU4191083.1 response regulator transcription factor [Pseudomonadota bacterium]ADU64192.1 response regulator receiver [Pseudodesulfovibrio aespoeensis Aspo-2]MBU4245388.1 response regulator transcription factor [Pseudomonadota bacterium]MBU4377566.1 response regulator transcription factor [Pseudomonadota bacterium]MBU4474642.1 response regulator transcription factor [Pseudomonadota bacterium]